MSDALTSYRTGHGLSLEQFGRMLTPVVVKSTVSRWESGKVPAERVLEIERVTGISRSLIRPDLYPVEEAAQ